MSDHELNLNDLLGWTASDGETPISDSPAVKAVVRDLPDLDPSGLETQVSEAVAELLDVSIADVVSGVWSRLKEVREAADPRRHTPEEIVIVALAKHTIESEHRPSVEVLVDDVQVAEVPVELDLSLTVEGLRLKIRDGRIREVTAGQLHAAARLGVTGSTVLKKKTPTFKLPGRVDFGEDGIAVPMLRSVDQADPVESAA